MISVLLPTYNERENIAELIAAIDATLAEPHEIIVVDDNSPDGTWSIVEEAARTNPRVRPERRMTDRGLTKSLRRGIEIATGDIIVWMDCDFSMPPSVIPQLLAQIAAGADIAVGSRFVSGGRQKNAAGSKDSKWAIMLSTLGCGMMRLALFPSFHDYTSGFIAVRRTVFDKIRLSGDYGEYFIDLIVRAKLLGLGIVEIPYANVERKAGTSKTAPTFAILLKRCAQYGIQILRMEGLRVKHLLGMNVASQKTAV